MSAPMKKPRIDAQFETLTHDRSGRRYRLTPSKAKVVLKLIQELAVDDDNESELVPADEVFKDLHKKYGKGGSVVRGMRAREGLTQVELAEKIGVPQTDISQIENGKRPIGKKMAERLAKVFNSDYRVFL